MREQLLTLWPTADNVQACIKQEAEAIDDAVFLAVHQPMRFQRRDVGAGGSTVARSEADLLDEFLTPNLPEGRLILPIVGSSGVGKSHVIRWIDAQLRRRPDAKRWHIIRVPKGASLKGVLRILLEDLKGPAFDRLREALTNARDYLDPNRAARELQLSLRYRLEQAAKAATQRRLNGQARPGDKEVYTFGDPRALPALLGDPELEQKHWLAKPDGRSGVLALMAEQVTQEGKPEADARRHQFVPEDLVLSDYIDVSELSKQARDFYAKIHRGDSSRREEAVRVLNLVLDEAKNDLLQLGDNSLVELFGEVRAELEKAKQELVFLVEDFAVLSGLQGALLQVMIAEATRDGRQQLCTMRTALAYTEGYMAGRDTVLTRARSEWLLEDRPGDDDDILRRIERLVGAYLNAARVGQKGLQNAYKEGGSAGLRDWVPLVDDHDLEPAARDVVHTFGTSEDGYPLFPFNAAAVRQLTQRGSVDSRGQLIFNPRHIINNLLTRVLAERRAFERGVFPPPYLADELRSAEVTSEVGRRVPLVRLKQYLTLLRLWGDQPESTSEAARLPASVYEAFGLQPIDFGVTPAPESEPAPTEWLNSGVSRVEPVLQTSQSTPPPVEETEERRWREILEAWGSGKNLAQTPARELRGWIADALDAFLPTDALLLRPRKKLRDLIKEFYMPRSLGQGNVTPSTAFVVVAEDSVLDDPIRRAALVRTLMAFVRRYGVYKSWNYDGAEADGGLVRDFLDERAGTAVEYLRARHFQVEVDTRPHLVRGLLVGARALEVPGAHDRASQAELVAALLADAPKLPDGATGPWAEVQKSLFETRSQWRELLLEQVGARQGGASAVHAVDVAVLARMIAETKTDWKLGNAPPQSNNDRDYHDFVILFRNLTHGMEKAISEEKHAFTKWLPGATAWFGKDFDKEAVKAALRSLVTEGKKKGHVSGVDLEGLRRQLSDLSGLALVAAYKAAIALSGEPTRGEVLSLLAQGPGRVLGPAKQFVARMDEFLGQVERALAGREATMIGDVVQAKVKAVEDELESLDGLLQQCEEARA